MYQLGSLGYKNLPFAILTKFFQLWAEFPLKVIKSCTGEKKHMLTRMNRMKSSTNLSLNDKIKFPQKSIIRVLNLNVITGTLKENSAAEIISMQRHFYEKNLIYTLNWYLF